MRDEAELAGDILRAPDAEGINKLGNILLSKLRLTAGELSWDN